MAMVINGQRIDDAVVESEFGSIKSYHESLGNVSCCERDPEFRSMARDNVVARALLAQEAGRRIEPTPEAELDAAVEKLKEEYGGEGWFFARTGASPETMHLVRRDVDLDLRVRRLLQELGDEGGPPSEAELRRFYEEHLDLFKTAEEVRASHILKTGRGGSAGGAAEGRDQAYDLLRQVRQELLAGGNFDALAKQHSEKADEHIDLGFFKRNELAPEFEAVAFSLQVGEISPVFLSPFGYHLMKLTDRRPAMPRPFEECRGDVETLFVEERRQRRARELVERLRAVATVEEVTDAGEADASAESAAGAEVAGEPAR